MELFKPETTEKSLPAALLARDEALLEYCEASEHQGFLSFWEAKDYFIVLGYGKDHREEVFEQDASRPQVPILRRCSGGGTVLQGPGCLNYSLILPLNYTPDFESITGTNRFIMERIRSAISTLSKEVITVQGHTDLTRNGLKFSGNAQRRKRRSLLFHGSFLLHFDLGLISQTLRQPKQQPEYRKDRSHESFLTNLEIDRVKIEGALTHAWNAEKLSASETRLAVAAQIETLVSSKYSRDDWNFRH